MDFVTHTLTGAALASSVLIRAAQKVSPEVSKWPPIRRERSEWTALFCGVLASNVPDVDIFHNPYKGAGEGLSYMLHHRGFTHTVVFCVLVGAVLGLAFSLLPEKRRPTRKQLVTIGIVGALLHLVMDGTNDYGVHPFWPLWNGWIYGDFILLAEPLIIGALLPLALRVFFRDYGARGVNLTVIFVLVLLVGGFIGALWYRRSEQQFITAVGATLGSIWVLGQVLVRAERPRLWMVPWLSIAGVWVVFFACSSYVKAQARLLVAGDRSNHLNDVVTTPAAGNPLCWRVILISTSTDGQFVRARMGNYSLWPWLSSPQGCFEPLAPKSATLLDKPTPESKPDGPWFWAGRFEGRRADFDRWAKANPRVDFTRRFLRAPFWQTEPDGQVLLGDLRMDYEPELDKYCKYRFRPDRWEELEGWIPVPWNSPLLKEGGQ
jgi:inner membrane protein